MQPRGLSQGKPARYWQAWVAAVFLAGAFPLLFTPHSLFPDHRLVPHVLNASHIPFFFVLTWFALYLKWPWGGAGFFRVFVVTNLVVLIFGSGVESIQIWQGRQASAGDLIRNAIGASLAVTLHPLVPRFLRAIRLSIVSGLTVFVLVALFPLCKNTIDWIYSANRFPVLADFETPFERERWLGGEIVRLGGSENRVIGFEFDTAEYSTLALEHFDGDWRDYDCFRFRIFNPQEEIVRLYLRINDLEHDLSDQRHDDRFNRSIDVYPGWSSHRIDLAAVEKSPRDRLMNLREIRRILFFTSSLEKTVLLYFDDLRLDGGQATCGHTTITPGS